MKFKRYKKIFTVIANGESKGVFTDQEKADDRYSTWKEIMDSRSDYDHVSSSNSAEFIKKDMYQNEAGTIIKIMIQVMHLNC